jgi:hypothetical protein
MNSTDWEVDLSHIRHLTISSCDIRSLRFGSGRPIVLLHPLRTQLEYFPPLLRALDHGFDHGFAGVAPDLPGHSQSSAPAVAYTAPYFTNTIERFLEACDCRLGHQRQAEQTAPNGGTLPTPTHCRQVAPLATTRWLVVASRAPPFLSPVGIGALGIVCATLGPLCGFTGMHCKRHAS